MDQERTYDDWKESLTSSRHMLVTARRDSLEASSSARKWRHDDENDTCRRSSLLCSHFDAGLCAGDLGRNTEKHPQLLVDGCPEHRARRDAEPGYSQHVL